MLIRIVRMTFIPEQVDSFLELFDATKEKIRSFEGCQHLELLQDYNQSNVFITYSHWESEEHLNHYRFSPLFGEVWKADMDGEVDCSAKDIKSAIDDMLAEDVF